MDGIRRAERVRMRSGVSFFAPHTISHRLPFSPRISCPAFVTFVSLRALFHGSSISLQLSFVLFLSRFDDTDDFLLFIYSFSLSEFRWRAISFLLHSSTSMFYCSPPSGNLSRSSDWTPATGYLMTSSSPQPLPTTPCSSTTVGSTYTIMYVRNLGLVARCVGPAAGQFGDAIRADHLEVIRAGLA